MKKSELKQEAVKGIAWNLIERFGVQGIIFIIGIILARILTPTDFGLIGMVTIFLLISQVFVQGGLGKAYIQKSEVNDTDANTIFYFNILISILFYVFLWICAPLIASFYKQDILIKLVRVISVIIVINAFSVIQVAQLSREINFKRKTIISFVSAIISGSIGILAAVNEYGVWALVIFNLLNRLIFTIGLWFTSKWKPSLIFSFKSLKGLISYGSWILFAGVIRTIFDNIYLVVIGKLFPIAQLGFYSKAKELQKYSSDYIASSIGLVSFPILSKIQNNIPELKNTFKNFLIQSTFILSPISVIVIILAQPLTEILLTNKWLPLVPYLQLLCIRGILYPFNLLNIQLLLSLGRSKTNFKLNLIKNSLRILNISLMYNYGIIYILYGEIFITIVSLVLNTYYTKKLIDYGLLSQIMDTWKILLSVIISGLISLVIIIVIEPIIFKIIIGIIFTITIFILVQYFYNRKDLLSTIEILKMIKIMNDKSKILNKC